MHELSIAQGIVDIVRQYVVDDDLHKVVAVKLKVGTVSGIVADSLEFCFQAVTTDTPLAGAALNIESVPFTVQCRSCGAESLNEQGIVLCGACGSADTTVVRGTELHVVGVELKEESPETS